MAIAVPVVHVEDAFLQCLQIPFVGTIQIRLKLKVCISRISYVSPARVTRPHHCPEVFLRDMALRVLITEVVELHSQQFPVFIGRVGHDEVEVSVGEAYFGHFRPLTPGMKLVTFRV